MMSFEDLLQFLVPTCAAFILIYPFVGPLLLNFGMRHLKAAKRIKAGYAESFLVLSIPIGLQLLLMNLVGVFLKDYNPNVDFFFNLILIVISIVSFILLTHLVFWFFYRKMKLSIFLWVLLFPLLFSLSLVPLFILVASVPI